MSKATRILNEHHIKQLILKGNPQYENFYKEELIEFCKISKQEIDRLNNIINELEKWLNEYYKSNRKWYNAELSNHDKQYYEEIYRNTEFMIVKFLKQLKKLKENK